MKRKTAGLTLFELIITTCIFGMVFIALLQSAIEAMNFIKLSHETTIATFHCKNMMEKIRNTAFVDLNVQFPNNVADGSAGNEYSTLLGGYELKDESITVFYPDETADPREIQVIVQWTDLNGRSRSVSLSTFKTR